MMENIPFLGCNTANLKPNRMVTVFPLRPLCTKFFIRQISKPLNKYYRFLRKYKVTFTSQTTGNPCRL